MAVIIINETPAPSVVKQCICRNCGVTLQYTPNDTTSVSESDYGGGRDTFNVIHCVKCNTRIRVSIY